MATIFISYSRSDQATINKLISRLEAVGHEVWLDREDIIGGENWRQKIVEAIESRDVFLLALSPNSVKSDHVRAEIDLAKEGHKRIIPINLQLVEIPSTMKYQLAGVQRIDLFTDAELGFQQLLGALGLPPAIEARPEESPRGTTTTAKQKFDRRVWLSAGAAALVTLVLLTGYLLANKSRAGSVASTETQIVQVTPEVDLAAQLTPGQVAESLPTTTTALSVPTSAPTDVPDLAAGGPFLAAVDLHALTSVEELEPLLTKANIHLSEPGDKTRTRSYFTGPDSAYHMLAVAALTIVGERKFIQPVNLDIVDKWYTQAVGSGYAARGPLDLEIVKESLIEAHNDYYVDDATSLEELLEPRE